MKTKKSSDCARFKYSSDFNCNMKSFQAIILKEEDIYVAKCPEVGTVSQGQTVEEALENLKEATELYLEEFPEKEFSQPILKTFEVAEVAKA